jgi:hypothetical protein
MNAGMFSMYDQLVARLGQLQAEYETGQKALAEL